MKLRFLPAAYRDVERLHSFLSPKNPNAARRAVDLIYGAAVSLKEDAGKGRPLGSGFRELIVPFGKGAYVLRYRVDEPRNAVVIARVWHSKERR